MATPTSGSIAIVDVTDESSITALPPCTDPGFDHRSCDYWEDAERCSKAIRLDWIEPPVARDTAPPASPAAAANPFRAEALERSANPFAPAGSGGGGSNPFLADDAVDANPFAPRRAPRPNVGAGAP